MWQLHRTQMNKPGLILFQSECDRDSMDYVEAIRCLFQVNPVNTLKCLVNKENGKPIIEWGAGINTKGIQTLDGHCLSTCCQILCCSQSYDVEKVMLCSYDVEKVMLCNPWAHKWIIMFVYIIS